MFHLSHTVIWWSMCVFVSEGRVRELMGQCEEEGRRREEGEGEVRRERERAGDLERQAREGREREESLHSEIQAMTEVS